MLTLTKIINKKSLISQVQIVGQFGYRYMSHVAANELTHTITASDLREVIENYQTEDKTIFLDVREDDECNEEFLPQYNDDGVKLHVVRIPFLNLIELDHDRLSQIAPFKDDHQILVFCRSGNKSVSATRLLSYNGYDTINIKGGMTKIREHLKVCSNGKLDLSLIKVFEISKLFHFNKCSETFDKISYSYF